MVKRLGERCLVECKGDIKAHESDRGHASCAISLAGASRPSCMM